MDNINGAKTGSDILPLAFIQWFYGIAPKKIVGIWGNYINSNMHFFSVPLLLKTLTAPWHRDRTSYGRGFDASSFWQVLGENTVSRVIGLIVRGFVIILALVVEVFILFAGLVFLVFWLLLPFILFSGIAMSLSLLIFT